MKAVTTSLLILILFSLSISAKLYANSIEMPSPEQPSEDLGKYVSINIEIKELKESGIVLREASEKLSLALDEVSENLQDLSPEQLRLINDLADKVDSMTNKLNRAVGSFPETIKKAQQPSNELLTQSLKTVRDETVTPIVDSINRWLIITIIGLVLIGIGLLVGFVIGLKKVSAAGSKILQIADGYRIIPLEQYNESRIAPLNKAPQEL